MLVRESAITSYLTQNIISPYFSFGWHFSVFAFQLLIPMLYMLKPDMLGLIPHIGNFVHIPSTHEDMKFGVIVPDSGVNVTVTYFAHILSHIFIFILSYQIMV